MLNSLKKVFLLLILILPVLNSCKKKTEEIEPVLNIENEVQEQETVEPVVHKEKRIPKFIRNVPDAKLDIDIDDSYFSEQYPCSDFVGCYIKTKPGISSKMYSKAGFDRREYYAGTFKEGDLGVLLYVYHFMDSEAACSIWLRIYNINTGKEGWVLYHPVHHKDFLFTTRQLQRNDKAEIQTINAKVNVSMKDVCPDTLSLNTWFSKDNSKYASIVDDKIYVYISGDEKMYRFFSPDEYDFKCDNDSRIIFSDDADLMYCIYNYEELYQFKLDDCMVTQIKDADVDSFITQGSGTAKLRTDALLFDFDPFKPESNRGYEIKFIENELDTEYFATYDYNTRMFCIYSDSYDLLYTLFAPSSYSEIVWNADKIYFFKDDCDRYGNYCMDVFTIDIEQKKVLFPLVFDYDPDIKAICSSPFLFYDEDDDYYLWVRFSTQGMYAVYSVDNYNGEVLEVIRGEYDFVDASEARLYIAGDTGNYVADPDRYKKYFKDIPLLGTHSDWETVNISIEFERGSPRGWCDYFGK